MQETLDKTSLSGVQPGDRVNLERAVTADTRLGGHIVQGHVDGVGTVVRRTPSEHWEVVEISLPADARRATSSTRARSPSTASASPSSRPATDRFTVSLIPETLARTTLGTRQPGDRVNLEVDVLAKHVEKLLAHRGPTRRSELMLDWLLRRHHLRRRRLPVASARWSATSSASASALLGMRRLVWAWPVGLVGNAAAVHRLRERRAQRRGLRAAVGPGRAPGDVRRGQPLRLVALVAARAARPTAARSRRAGRPGPSASRCSRSRPSATPSPTSCCREIGS